MTRAAIQQDDDDAERRRLGERLREARKYLGLKQEEVATYLKIPRTALTDIENGQRRVEAIELTRLALSAAGRILHGRGRGGGLARRCRASCPSGRRAVDAGS
jgi:DNA-binding XRE family transcriptional regulator